ncbi:hypothetical protein DRO69_08440 [Candidatus Bathyarchaeota archaeon]|nr:MAG: hypothetical protein DRO69_08440 [Candidatus Bathyarchaeota archaeon]
MSKLYELFSNTAVESFGKALRTALTKNEDYASLIELDYAEKEEDFAIAIKKFLRRLGKEGYKPNERDLDEIMKLAQEYGVKLVCAAVISHALAYPHKGE